MDCKCKKNKFSFSEKVRIFYFDNSNAAKYDKMIIYAEIGRMRIVTMSESAVSWFKTIIVALILVIIIRSFIFNTTIVMGQSMEPTLHERDRLICLVFPKYFSDFDTDDVVVIHAPDGSGQDYIKRVIGVPGDVVSIEQGQVYVNGVEKEENYIHENVETEVYGIDNSQWTLGEDEYFLLGDNRNHDKSLDSRVFGPIRKDQIKSKASFRFWPLSDIKKF